MKTKSSAIFFFLIASAAVYAQMGPPPGMPPAVRDTGDFGPGGFGPHPGKVVTGAPYSADVTNSRGAKSADGNSIQRTTTGHVARDNDGRTYSQETITGGFLGQNGPSDSGLHFGPRWRLFLRIEHLHQSGEAARAAAIPRRRRTARAS